MRPDNGSRIVAEIVVEDICNDIDQVVVYSSTTGNLTAHPFARDGAGIFTETEHDLRDYPAVQAVVAGRLSTTKSITWDVPLHDADPS